MSLIIVLTHTFECLPPVVKTFFEFFILILNVKHINKHLNSSEDGFPLYGKILFHEGVLSAAVPEVEGESAHELDFVLLTFDGVSDFTSVFGRKVGEDDRVHGGFAGTGVPHEEHFLHLGYVICY